MTTIPELVREYYNSDPGTLPPFKTRLLDCCRVHNIVGYLWNQSKLARCLCRLHDIVGYLWNQSKLAVCLCRLHNIVGYLWNQSKLAVSLCRLHNIVGYLWNQSKLAGCLSVDRTTLLVTCGISPTACGNFVKGELTECTPTRYEKGADAKNYYRQNNFC